MVAHFRPDFRLTVAECTGTVVWTAGSSNVPESCAHPGPPPELHVVPLSHALMIDASEQHEERTAELASGAGGPVAGPDFLKKNLCLNLI